MNNIIPSATQTIIPDRTSQDISALISSIGSAGGDFLGTLRENADYDAIAAYTASGNDPKKFPAKAIMRLAAADPDNKVVAPFAEQLAARNKTLGSLRSAVSGSHEKSPIRNSDLSQFVDSDTPLFALAKHEKELINQEKSEAVDLYLDMIKMKDAPEAERGEIMKSLGEKMSVIQSVDVEFDMKGLVKEVEKKLTHEAMKSQRQMAQNQEAVRSIEEILSGGEGQNPEESPRFQNPEPGLFGEESRSPGPGEITFGSYFAPYSRAVSDIREMREKRASKKLTKEDPSANLRGNIDELDRTAEQLHDLYGSRGVWNNEYYTYMRQLAMNGSPVAMKYLEELEAQR